jgi:hypothetical protein
MTYENRISLLLLVLLLVALAACSKPSSPRSAETSPSTAEQDTFSSLQKQMRHFGAQLAEYKKCVAQNGDSACSDLAHHLNNFKFGPIQ